MNWLDPHWMQTGLNALKATVDTDPHVKQQMVQFLFDEGFWNTEKLKWDGAIARFNACLNPQKPDYFKIGEVWALMKRFGRHELFHTMAADLGYEVRPLPTETRRQELLVQLVDLRTRAANAEESIARELARLGMPADLPRLDPAIRAGVGSFSLPPEPDPDAPGGF